MTSILDRERIAAHTANTTAGTASDPLSVSPNDFGGDYRDGTEAGTTAAPYTGPKGITSKSAPAGDVRDLGEGDSLMARILGGAAARTAAIDARSTIFRGANSGGIPNDKIMVTDPNTGVQYTWAEVKQGFADEGNYFSYMADGVKRYSVFDASMSLEDWFTGGYGDAYASFLSGEDTKDINVLDLITDPPRTGSGSGGSSAKYVPPSSDSIAEQVKAYVVATTGTLRQDLIDQATASYMKAHRASFDKRETVQIDPWTDTLATVRNSREYKAIHAGRPESVNEMEWVTSRQVKLRQIGISDQRSEQLGINAAIAGSSDEALVGQAKVSQVADTGRLLQQHRDSLRQSAVAVAGLL